MAETKMTTDHQEIIAWVNQHAGQPAKLTSASPDRPIGTLRIEFPDAFEPDLELIEWDEFFKILDEEQLAFLYQEEERFYKFVRRGLEVAPEERRGARAGRRR
jgi:hypothetical protein